MRATYRRLRKADSLASSSAVQSIIDQLRVALPDIIPRQNKELIRMLRAVRHIHRYQASDTKRGRPSRWKREDLLKVSTQLTTILDRETSSHISLASFVDHHLRLLEFPAEAEQLARITPERLGVSSAQAKRMRTDLVSTHLQTKSAGGRLRQRVGELLCASSAEAGITEGTNPELDLEYFDPYDPTHLFGTKSSRWVLLFERLGVRTLLKKR
jgi:hypothetical protein